jgi:hypothetical protein
MLHSIKTLIGRIAAALDKICGLEPPAPEKVESQSYKRVAFYFSAHGDDWQLFMNPPAFEDVLDPQTKVVFVHTTAGDAGLGTGADGRKYPFFLARENGSKTGIRFMCDSEKRPVEEKETLVPLNGKSIHRTTYRNTVLYFFRVPDGCGAGTGYETTGFQSLERCATGKNETLTAIDGSASYQGWDDFVETVRALYDYERAGIESIDIHVPELDAKTNPGDHSDHRHTAQAALEAATHITNARRFHHLGYVVADMPENLNSKQMQLQTSAFAATVAGLLAFDHESSWAPHYWPFLGRSYCRIEQSGEGSQS